MENLHWLFQLLTDLSDNWRENILLSRRLKSGLTGNGTDQTNHETNRRTRHRYRWSNLSCSVCIFLILFLFFFPKGSCATYYGQIRTKTSKDGGRTIAVFRSRSEPTSSANFWIAMIWTWFAERIRSSKMVTNFSLKDNWSLYSRLRTIAGNSTTQGGWWVSTRHSCALFR